MKRQGYTLVEVLMVVMLIGILASISGPIYFQQRNRALASEALAMMSLIRQSLRDYHIVSDAYYDIAGGNVHNALPTSVSAGTPTPSTAGADVDAGVAQFFSNHAYSVDATSPSSARFSNPPVVDFLITVNAGDSVACSSSVSTNCAIYAGRVANYDLEMDNSGRIFVSYDNGSHWQLY